MNQGSDNLIPAVCVLTNSGNYKQVNYLSALYSLEIASYLAMTRGYGIRSSAHLKSAHPHIENPTPISP
ncbi:hypothetical protein M2273_005412 [Mucilaginibacter lappiensis]